MRQAQNFKNSLLTLALQHQKMIAYNLASTPFFKSSVEIKKVKSKMVATFPENVQNALYQRDGQKKIVLGASSVCVDGIKCSTDMVFSVGSCSGLPDFRQIEKIIAIKTDIIFISRHITLWYNEHLRVYELCSSHLSTCFVTQ